MNSRASVKALFLMMMFGSLPVGAVPIGHHGGMILDCKPPQFFDESPAADSKAAGAKSVSVTSSDDTDADTIKFWIDNQPVKPTVAQERSGRYRIEAPIPGNVSGRIWVKVEAYSHDGCDNFKSWHVTLN